MANAKHGGPAFPQMDPDSYHPNAEGMTLRDYFAGQALAGLMSHTTIEFLTPDDIAERAYEKADAMLKARESTQ